PAPPLARYHRGGRDGSISNPGLSLSMRDRWGAGQAKQTAGLLPQGYCLELYQWSEVAGGEDLHDRFFLTDVGGIMIGAGLSAGGPTETATFTLLDVDHAQRLRGRFSPNST